MKTVSSIVAIALLASSTIALAMPAPDAKTQPTAEADMPFASANRIDARALAAVTGRDDIAMTIRANNSSNVSNNSVIGQSQTGAVSFDGQAFSGVSGLSLVSANSGNNVSINASMNLNVSIRP